MNPRAALLLLAFVGILTIPSVFGDWFTAPNQSATAVQATSYAATPSTDLTFPIAADVPKTAPKKEPAVSTKKTAEPARIAPESQQETRSDTLYPYNPLSFDTVNILARAALVNIFCETKNGGSFEPISGSGVIIDPRGVILTNAHVAQYLLLAESGKIELSCVIRTGSPALPTWRAEVMYLPAEWIAAHAADITKESPTGTGEHDFALLHITSAVGSQKLPDTFPYLPFDARENIIQSWDTALVAGYPAGFVGGIIAQRNLYASSAVTTIGQLYTFDESHTVDLVSLGGVVLAQAGSSGGPVANAWGYLVGIVATSSFGDSTQKRDLRAITIEYINRAMRQETGTDLLSYLKQDPTKLAAQFSRDQAPALVTKLVNAIENPNRAQ